MHVNLRKWLYLFSITLASLGLLAGLGTIYVEFYSDSADPYRLFAAGAMATASMVAGFAVISARWLRARGRELARRVQYLEQQLDNRQKPEPQASAPLNGEISRECYLLIRDAWYAQLDAGAWITALQTGERIKELFPNDPLAGQVAETLPTLAQRVQADILVRRGRRLRTAFNDAAEPSTVQLELPNEVAEPAQSLAG